MIRGRLFDHAFGSQAKIKFHDKKYGVHRNDGEQVKDAIHKQIQLPVQHKEKSPGMYPFQTSIHGTNLFTYMIRVRALRVPTPCPKALPEGAASEFALDSDFALALLPDSRSFTSCLLLLFFC